MFRIILVLAILASVPNVEAQFRSGNEVGDLSGFVNSGNFSMNYQRPLLDPNRMTFHHSFSMGVSSSSNANYGSGSYLGSLEYRLSNTTDLTLHVGMNSLMYNGSASNGIDSNGTANNFIGGAEFRWNPSDNFELRIGAFKGMPGGSQSNYYSPWSQSSFLR
jgi:hypothetical protein